jgi:hypothetical protein
LSDQRVNLPSSHLEVDPIQGHLPREGLCDPPEQQRWRCSHGLVAPHLQEDLLKVWNGPYG